MIYWKNNAEKEEDKYCWFKKERSKIDGLATVINHI